MGRAGHPELAHGMGTTTAQFPGLAKGLSLAGIGIEILGRWGSQAMEMAPGVVPVSWPPG